MSEPAEEPVPPAPPHRAGGPAAAWLAGVLLVAAIGVVTTPFWAPTVMRLLPWGAPARTRTQDPTLAALEALRAEQAKTAAALQQLSQRVGGLEARPPAAAPDLAPVQQQLQQLAQMIAGLEAKPPPAAADLAPVQQQLQQLEQKIAGLEAKPSPAAPDLVPVQQQLAALSKSVADLTASVATLEKAPPRPVVDPANTAIALVLLQIREALDVARPFKAEYAALIALAGDRPDIAAAAAPLERPAATGVASRAALAGRLHQLAPQMATAEAPADPGWWGWIVGELRSLVTIRRIDGASQTPAEAAVSGAERALVSGDLGGAVAALEGLTGASKEAADPWLRIARNRLLAETTLRRIEALVTAQLGGAARAPGAPG